MLFGYSCLLYRIRQHACNISSRASLLHIAYLSRHHCALATRQPSSRSSTMENVAACFCACRAVRCLRPRLCSRRLPPNFGNRTPSREILQLSKTHVAVEFNDLGVLLTCDLRNGPAAFQCSIACMSGTRPLGAVARSRPSKRQRRHWGGASQRTRMCKPTCAIRQRQSFETSLFTYP